MEQLVSLSLASFSVEGQSFKQLYTISDAVGRKGDVEEMFIVRTECSYVCSSPAVHYLHVLYSNIY